MRVSHKSKRVSWASEVNLCQVRLFLSEEAPSQVGLDSQDHLQAKSSLLSHPNGPPSSDDVLPPGFEASHPVPDHLQTKLSQIPTIKWKCPLRFVLDLTWQVVAGEESNEAGIQNQREMRILEAIYPRPSAIPPNPSFVSSSEDSSPHDDSKTPSIPITPIEDEDYAADTQLLPEPTSRSLQPPVVQPSSSSDNPPPPPGMALAAALTGIANNNTNNDQGSLIDRDLLLKILSNPKMVEKLVTDYGATNNQPQPQPQPQPPPPPTVAHVNRPWPAQFAPPVPGPPPTVAHLNRPRPAQFAPPVPGPPPPPPPPGPAKDLSYYKSLIQQHGGDRQEPLPAPLPPPQYGGLNNRYNHQVLTSQEPINGQKQPRGDSKSKNMKPCIYFNSSRGCRHGANCTFQHDASFQPRGGGGGGSMPEVQNAKRTKFDREISS